MRLAALSVLSLCFVAWHLEGRNEVGREVAIPRHLQDGEEFTIPVCDLIRYGQQLFEAHFTAEEGAGRPLTKGTGKRLTDPSRPLLFPRNFNRISGPDSNSCAGCHNQPSVGGAGDLSNNVFVAGQRFDFATFDPADAARIGGSLDERNARVTLQSIANGRATPELFGVGFYELVARQISMDLRAIRYRLKPGESAALQSKGISFGVLSRLTDGTWDTSRVEGLPAPSLMSDGSAEAPSLTILPFHQSGTTVSLRVFAVDSFNQHHGMQATERFGIDRDPDGDGVPNELTRADITAISLFQAALPVPVRTLSQDPIIRRAAEEGEKLFKQIGCAGCHIPSLPLYAKGWLYTEPNPNNPMGNLQAGQAPVLALDLTSDDLPQPRLHAVNGVVQVPLYTDFKLHDLCKEKNDPNREPVDANEHPGSAEFFAGNGKFLTRRLWAVGSKPNFFHHGQFTTIRDAILNHYGEAASTRQAFVALQAPEQGELIEFLKSLKAPTEARR